MTSRPFVALACAHLTDERLYAAQVAALGGNHECRVFVFRDHDSLGFKVIFNPSLGFGTLK